MSTGANFAGLKFSSHSDYRMLSRRKRLLESFKEITKLFSIFLSQLSPFFRLTQFFSPSILPSFNKSRNNRVAFLQRHQGLIIPRKVSEKCDETAEALFFIISFILFRVNRFHRRSCYSPSPSFFIEDDRSRYQPRFLSRSDIEVLKSRLERRGGEDEAKHSCKKILQRVKSRCVVSISGISSSTFAVLNFCEVVSSISRAPPFCSRGRFYRGSRLSSLFLIENVIYV